MATDLDVEVVGREFVRQYYTVLNQRPDCLHQFFTRDSSFVHGGVERPGEEQPACQGQAVIHQKILSLNFRDCHTKIRQVDCQKTVGNAVLVQVSGELSNNGEPMRKFMQSFVLVQQAPKNFYVHNDIFRYQDEVFHDYHYAPPPVVQEQVPIDEPYVNHEAGKQEVPEKESMEAHQQPPVSENVANGNYCPAKEQIQTVGVPLAHNHEVNAMPAVAAHLEAVNLNGSVPETQKVGQEEKVPESAVKAEEVTLENGSPKDTAEEKTAQAPAQPQQQKFFSWASMASKNASSSAPSTTSATPQGKPQATIKPERKSEVAPVVNPAISAVPVATGVPAAPGPKNQAAAPQPRGPAVNDRKWSPEGDEGGFRSPPSFVPDNQQLFIGNLPHSITEQEIRELFEKFGNVIDIKINRKGASRDLPNFGFVAFDNHEAVGKAMKAKPILLHGKRRINIEEKKDQSNVGNGPRRIPARGGRGGMRGGPRTTGPRTNGGHPASQTLAAETEE